VLVLLGTAHSFDHTLGSVENYRRGSPYFLNSFFWSRTRFVPGVPMLAVIVGVILVPHAHFSSHMQMINTVGASTHPTLSQTTKLPRQANLIFRQWWHPFFYSFLLLLSREKNRHLESPELFLPPASLCICICMCGSYLGDGQAADRHEKARTTTEDKDPAKAQGQL